MSTSSGAPTVAFTTLGCKVNQSETDLLARQFAAAGYQNVSFDGPADVYVVNTCTVTHVADRKSRQTIGQARRRNPDSLVVATGCYASIVGQLLADDRTLVVRNRDKERLVSLVDGRLHHVAGTTPYFNDSEKYLDYSGGQERSRAMVKVQDGCDSHCAYCIIPRVRGRSRSLPPERVLARVNALVREGHAEIVITGVDLGSYGEDDPSLPDLGGLLKRIVEETDVPRVRVSSLEPGDFDRAWLDLWTDTRLCRHLHVPLQSGSGSVLRRMGRAYEPEGFAAMVASCREVSRMTITTDVMVGFPGESDEEFEEGFRFIREIAFDGMHVFKYSRRSGTRAAHMEDQVPEQIKTKRSAVLRAEADRGIERLLARHADKMATVAWESEREGIRRGVTDTNVRVYGSHASPTGRLDRVRLQGRHADGLWAQPAQVDIPLIPIA